MEASSSSSSRRLAVSLLAVALAAAGATPAGAEDELGRLAALPRDRQAAVLPGIAAGALLSNARARLGEFGVYRARVQKQERVGGRLLEPQVVEATIREHPRALRLHFFAGPSRGRRALYNAALRPAEVLVKEAGLLGLFAVWLPIDSPLTRRDTNHPISNLGFGALLDFLQRDLDAARSAGGHTRHDEGFDPDGTYCIRFTAPPETRNLYAARTRLCLNLGLGVPVKIDVFDRQGLLELFRYEDVRIRQPEDADLFTAGAGTP